MEEELKEKIGRANLFLVEDWAEELWLMLEHSEGHCHNCMISPPNNPCNKNDICKYYRVFIKYCVFP